MNKTFIVFKQELASTVKRKSFLITLFALPLIGFAITWFVGGFGQNEQTQQITEMLVSAEEPEMIGIVDHSDLINTIPEDAADTLVLFESEEAAAQAINSGTVAGYYIVAEDYIQSGAVTLVRPDFNPLGGMAQSGLVERLLNQRILGEENQIAQRIQIPMNLDLEVLRPETERDPGSELNFFLPYAVTMLFYFVILGSSSLMLNSVTKEKSNRVMEILMTSITPNQMLVGKIIALGIVGLLQTIVWTGSGFLLLRLSGRAINLSSGFQLPPSILVWGILFFVLGYAFYATIMAGVGALVPNIKEASQATTIVIIPMIVPLMLIGPLSQEPNSVLSVILSLIPLTSPITIMTRLAAGTVPVWQILLSAVILAASAYYVIRVVAGFFRAQNLLSGEKFELKRFLKAFVGKV